MYIHRGIYSLKQIAPFMLCIFFNSCCASNLVNTTHGAVRGMWEYVQGSKVYKYLSIPYAEPPVGDYRFMDPVPPQPWKTVRNTIRYSPLCLGVPAYSRQEEMGQRRYSEDCLYLNVFVPEVS